MVNHLTAGKPPSVSMIMAVRNGEPFLAAAVEGILHQTYRDFECIIVNDASTDGTAEWLRAWATADPRLVLLDNTAQLGMAASLNRALEAVRGRYIARHDADDYSTPTRLQEQVEFLDQHPQVGLLGTLVQVIDDHGQALGVGAFEGGLDNAALQAELLDHNPLCHGSVMLRSACLSQVGNYDESLELTEDYDLWLRLAEVTCLAKLPKALYSYRVHAASMSFQRRAQQVVAQARTLEKAMRRRHGTNPPPALARQVAENYRLAADAYTQRGDLVAARQYLVRAITLYPQLFEALEVYLPLPNDAGDLAFGLAVLADLPATRRYQRIRRLLRSRLHMRRVFAAAGRGDHAELKQQLWPGLLNDPRWLLNRGVWVLAARTLLRSHIAGTPPVHKDRQA